MITFRILEIKVTVVGLLCFFNELNYRFNGLADGIKEIFGGRMVSICKFGYVVKQ
jgi:hypothetical protein